MATVSIIYEGRDVTVDLAPFLTAFTFTDNSGSNADDISFTLEDRNSLWLEHWMPAKGDTISAGIIHSGKKLSCGAFEVDEISYTMPPRSITIKAVSCAVSRHSRGENHNHSWESTSLQEIAQDIASFNNLSLFYDAPGYSLERREQYHTPDLQFLEALCNSFGLSVKVSDDTLIIYSEEEYTQSQESVATLTPQDKRLISASFTSKSAKIYRKAKVSYHHPVKNETYYAEYEDEDEEGSERELEIYERVDSQQQAHTVAKQTLLRTNSREITATLTMLGNTSLMAGLTITLEGFGMFAGKYFIEKVTHSVGNSGWTASLSLKMGGGAKKSAKKRKAVSRKKSTTTTTGGAELADDSRGY